MNSIDWEKNIMKPVLMVLILCILIAIFINIIQYNSEDYSHKKYTEIKEENYQVVIINMLEDRPQYRVKDVRLSDNSVKQIKFFIYEKLNVGDSIVKHKNSDSVIYIKKNGERIYDDVAKNYREKIK